MDKGKGKTARMPASIELFGREVSVYALMALSGIAACALVIRWLYPRRSLSGTHVVWMALVGGFGLLIGSHLLYGVTKLPEFIEKLVNSAGRNSFYFEALFYDTFGGMVYYGGLIGLLLACYLYSRRYSLSYPKYSDLMAVCTPLFHAFGRVGCFASGCCYGVEWEYGIVSYDTYTPEVNLVARFPVQLLEAGLNLLLFALLLFLFLRGIRSGALLRTYLLIYPVIRFFDEFLRGDLVRGMFAGLSTSQWISIGLLLFAIWWERKERKAKNTTEIIA